MKRKKTIKVGLDFDGVVAYNPVRIFRFPVTFIKKKVFKIKETKFFYPKTNWQKKIWEILHKTSIFPNFGIKKLEQAVKEGEIEGFIISGRYGYLEDSLNKWLNKYQISWLFKEVIINRANQQPHIFKENQIKKLKLDVYIEDNWDIVDHLSKSKAIINKTKIFWIYNIMDYFTNYPYKYSSLGEALKDIKRALE